AFKVFDVSDWRRDDAPSKSAWVQRALDSLSKEYPWSVASLSVSTLVVSRQDVAMGRLLRRLKKEGLSHVLKAILPASANPGSKARPGQSPFARDTGGASGAVSSVRPNDEGVAHAEPGGERDEPFIRPVISAGVGESTPTDTHTGRVVPGSYRDTNPGDRYEPLPGS